MLVIVSSSDSEDDVSMFHREFPYTIFINNISL